MSRTPDRITVFYDGACPACVRDRRRYEQLAGETTAKRVCWVDITGREAQLRQLGVDPALALRELHVQDEQRRLHSEMDAYILLLSQITWLRPLAWLIGLPLIRPTLAALYHWQVNRRLRNSGRLG